MLSILYFIAIMSVDYQLYISGAGLPRLTWILMAMHIFCLLSIQYYTFFIKC